MRNRNDYARVLVLAAVTCSASLATSASLADDRYYDPDRRDYHSWDRDEDTQFRIYLRERNAPLVEFRNVDPERQRAYWRWRHERQEHERENPDRR